MRIVEVAKRIGKGCLAQRIGVHWAQASMARLFTLCVLVSALALPVAEASPDSRLTQQAAKHQEEGLALFQQGEYEGAIDELQIAYGLSSEPILLFHLAEAYDRLGYYIEAQYYYRSYLEEEPEGAAERRALERIEAITEILEGPSEEEADPLPEPEPLPDSQPEVAAEAHKASAPGRGLRVAGAATVGAGLVLGGASGYFAMQARSQAQDISDLFDQGVTWQPEFDEMYESGRRDRRNARLLMATGGAAALAGTALYYLGVRSGNAGRIEVSPTSGGAAVSLSWEL
jgi:tetratricopeptide (TPR) repeat protein